MKNRSLIRLISGLVFLLLVAACSGTGPADQNTLQGSRWTLVGLADETPLGEVDVTAEFSEGQVAGNSGCNSYSGTYEVDGENIEIGELTMTLMACLDPDGIMDQEQRFLELLAGSQTFTVEGDQLILHTSSGETLTFSAQE